MSYVTTIRAKSKYAYAITPNGIVRSKYYMPLANSVTSWREQLPAGSKSLQPHKFSVTKTTLDFTGGMYDVYGSTIGGHSLALVGAVDLYSGSLPTPSYNYDCQGVKALADQKAYVKASDPYFHELHQLGELAETVKALKSPLSGTRKLVGKMSEWSKQPKLLTLPVKEAAGTYLEHLFGTLPAIEQAATIGDAVGRMLDKKYPTLKTSRGGAKSEQDNGVEYASSYIGGISRPIFDRCYCVYKIDRKVSKRSSSGIIVKNPRLRNSNSIAAIAAEGYQLLPLSFFVDNFVKLGTLLKECRPVPGEIIGSWNTSVVDATYTYTLLKVIPARGGPYATRQAATYTMHRTYIVRDIDITRTGKIHLGPGLNSIGKILSTCALGITLKK